METTKYPVITLDGPAGAGKTTMARYLAETLDGFVCLDTGAIYRAVAYAADTYCIDPTDMSLLSDVKIGIRFKRNSSSGTDQVMTLDNAEIPDRLLRSQRISERSSEISTDPAVRQRVNQICREAACRHALIAEGRDTGTAVFPEAVMKFYLYASLEDRAQRRQLQARKNGDRLDLDDVMRSMAVRDQRDSTREHDPLKFPPDAIWIDTGIFLEESVKRILRDAVKARLDPKAAPVI